MTLKLLVADIGGTNSRFSVFETTTGMDLAPVSVAWLKTNAHSDFAGLLRSALKQLNYSGPISQTVIAVAGPIENGTFCDTTNIAWDIDLLQPELKELLPSAVLINDFLSQAYAVLSPLSASAELVKEGHPKKAATKAVLGAGTGLGKAILASDPTGAFFGVASEGGHSEFSFRPGERKLEDFFRLSYDLDENLGLSEERLVSGAALSRIHEFFSGESRDAAVVAAGFSEWPEVLNTYTRFLARVCRNFALETLSRGGLYLAGGVAAKNPLIFDQLVFAEEFHLSAVHREILEEIPVYLFDNESSGLWGAAWYAVQLSGVRVHEVH